MTTYVTQKISARTDAGALTGDEIFPLIRDGSTTDYKSTLTAVVTYLLTNPDILTLLEDRFGEHIASGEFDAYLQAITQRNADDTSVWGQSVDVAGNLVIAPESGLEGAVVVNGQGNVTLGLATFRTQVVSETSTSYQLSGQTDKAHVTRFSPAGACTVTLVQDSEAPTVNDRFFDSDWFILSRANTQSLTLTPGSGVTLTNAYTGATGSIPVTHKGGEILVRRVTEDSYVAWGDIPQANVDTLVTVASASNVTTLDLSLGNAFATTLTENTTFQLANRPSGVVKPVIVKVTQDSDTAKTTGFSSDFSWKDGDAFAVDTTLTSINVFGFTDWGDGADVTAYKGGVFS